MGRQGRHGRQVDKDTANQDDWARSFEKLSPLHVGGWSNAGWSGRAQ